MQQHELRPPKGATHKRKRVGRGNASGRGTYSTKGLKGQKARSGGGVRPGFEGGQLPLIRRMARKRGFRNPFRVDYQEVNVGKLAAFAAGSEVTAETLRAARLVQRGGPVKVLGAGDLGIPLTVEATRFSRSAREKIEAAGGTVRWLDGEPPPREEPRAAPPAAKKAGAAAKTTAASAPKSKARKQAEAPEAPEEADPADAEKDTGDGTLG
jgi:large subunit ribosomal protein L15